ncbi:TlpA family protein disulfide reductase [Gillisia limnaea]|uniref:Alkyl hydroperoxide reductase/ Thiol specific antioxidant/ Mal allergen n=1 Tax=Gillisia limnaea (strain DSM 15749 / LMG 21470 / R-8282) TaxID=865937 RepID=H2BVM5_GILLR|nr:TlpA disulfide reductase family protein [Gillisia limnaea]EHQ03981.1 alkyl hydroperoxide reductase/ Thiol specific antioxidant/ Mal allergen [Gillisia limnaea DSM 15749]
MNKKTKKNIIEYGIIGVVILTLFATGLHTEVIGFLQRGILKTGLMDPDLKDTNGFTNKKNNPPADYSLSLVNSKDEKINMEDFRGKVIFMNVWATWCPPCVAEMPGINNLYNDVKNEDIVFIMLSVDQDFQKAIDFNEKKGFDFEVFRASGPMPPQYNSQSLPTTFVIGADGTLALTHMGMGDYDTEEFKEFLKALK